MEIAVCVIETLFRHDLCLPEGGSGAVTGLAAPNRADLCAVEMAIGLRQRLGGRVTLLAVAAPESEATLAIYAGLGAEAQLRCWDPSLGAAGALGIAAVLARMVGRVGAELVLLGDGATGGDGTGLTGPAVAERLGRPFVAGIVRCDVEEPGVAVVERLVERGDRLVVEVPFPAVLAVSPEAPQTCYPAYTRAQRVARETIDLAGLGLSPDDVLAASAGTRYSGWTLANPRARKLFAPPSTASGAERLRMVMGGGRTQKPTADANIIEEPPERAAEQILAFLRQERVI